MAKSNSLVSFVSRFVGRPSHRLIIANTAWLFVDKAVCAAVGILVGAWVARYLQPTGFGQYSYALAFVQFLVPVAGLGLQSIVIRNIVREPESKEEILGTALILRAGASLLLVTALVVILAGGFLSLERVVSLLIAVISIQLVFNAFSDTIGDWFESQVRIKYVVWARDASTVIGGLIRIALILAIAPLVAFGVAASAQALLFAGGIIAAYRGTGNRLYSLRFSLVRAKSLLADSWPLVFSGLAIVTYMRIDQIMLGHLAGSETLGVYSVAVVLSELWYFIPVAIARSLFPTIVRSREHQTPQAFKARIQAFFDMMVGVSYTVALALTLAASFLVLTLFGTEYHGAVPILRIHIWAFVFVSLGESRYRWLMTENLVRFAMLSTIVGAGINIGLNFALIPKFGGVGAAWATLVSQAVSAYLTSLLQPALWGTFKQATLALLIPLRLPSFLRSLRTIGLR